MEISLARDNGKKVLLVESMIIPSKSVSDLFTGCYYSGSSVWICSSFRFLIDSRPFDCDSEGFSNDDVVFPCHALTSVAISD